MKVGFALSGGGALGAWQAGALKAIYQAGIRPSCAVGTSVGAINAKISHVAASAGRVMNGWRGVRAEGGVSEH